MPEIKYIAVSYLHEYACDECSQKPNPGCLLESTGKALPTSPMKYEYKCPNCEKIYILNELYPKITFEKEEKEDLTIFNKI